MTDMFLEKVRAGVAERLKGVEGLRVADASVMPLIPSSNIQPAALMIGVWALLIVGFASILLMANAAGGIRDDLTPGSMMAMCSIVLDMASSSSSPST